MKFIIVAILAIPFVGGFLVHLAGIALAGGGFWFLSASVAGTILALKRHG